MFCKNDRLLLLPIHKLYIDKTRKLVRFIQLLLRINLSLSGDGLIYRTLTAIGIYFPDGLNWSISNEALIVATGQLFFKVNSVCNPILYFLTLFRPGYFGAPKSRGGGGAKIAPPTFSWKEKCYCNETWHKCSLDH